MDYRTGSAQLLGKPALKTEPEFAFHLRAQLALCRQRNKSLLGAALQIAGVEVKHPDHGHTLRMRFGGIYFSARGIFFRICLSL
jgi:hypothetical protein